MKVYLLPALEDNYMYIIEDEKTKECAVVDPVEPAKILEKIQSLGLTLTKVLTTHHHWDHADGNPELVRLFGKPVEVFGGDDRVKAVNNIVKHGDRFTIGSLKGLCLFTPCHTTGHICYFITEDDDQSNPSVFTGDTLFTAGCGRFFEGTADMMYKNLIEILGQLPRHTKVYCGHEYTIQNLKYAVHVEPHNAHVLKRMEWAQQQRAQNVPTVPSTLQEEFESNPFMRVRESDVLKYAGTSDPIECMKFLRDEKNTFKG